MADDWDPFEDPADVSEASVDHRSREKLLAHNLQHTNGEHTTPPNIEASKNMGSTAASASPFTLQKAIEMQEELIAAYVEIDFQEKLFTALGRLFGDKTQMDRARLHVTWPIQAPIIERFGFERTRKGLQDSVRAFVPYNNIPDVKARNLHMLYLISPWMQDPVWKGQVRRKFDLETGLPDNTSLPPLLTLKQGLEIQDALIAEYSKPEFQEQLVTALKRAGDDKSEETRLLHALCFPVQVAVLTKYGFEPSRRGVHMSFVAFKPINLYPESDERALLILRLLNTERQDALAIPLDEDEVPAWEEEVPPGDAKEDIAHELERLACVPGVGLSICEGMQSQSLQFEEQEIRHLEHRPEVSMSEDALLCTQFVLDAPYPQVLRELSQMVACDKDGPAKAGSFEYDNDGKLFIFSPDGYTWMQESSSIAMPIEGMFAHRITIVHTVALSLQKRQTLAEDLWQRRLYSYTEVNDFFRFVPAATSGSERTLVSRSICSVKIAFEGDTKNLRPQLAKKLEDDNDTWITHFKPHGSKAVLQATSAYGAGHKDFDTPVREYAQDAKFKDKDFHTMELDEACAFQDELIAGYSTCEFQERLHITHAIASMAEKDRDVQQKRAHAQTCFLVQAPVLARFGYEPSRRGVMQSVRAFESLNKVPEIMARNERLFCLVHVEQQTREQVEEFLRNFVQSPAPSHIVLKVPDLYKADQELVSLAAHDLVAHMRLRLQFQNADPNIVVPTFPQPTGSIGELESILYTAERTPLIAAVESGQQAAFDLLLKFCPMVDINVVCCEWQIEGAYKRYTALDKAMLAKHEHASAMIGKLIVLGAKSAYDLAKPRRTNPFLNWEVHFPELHLSRFQLEDIAYYRECMRKENIEFFSVFDELEDNVSDEPLNDTDEARDKDKMRAQPWRWPPFPSGQDKDLGDHIQNIKDHITHSKISNIQGQHRLFRQLFLQWHPDKQRGDTKLATKVFQWLQELREKTLC